MDVVEIFEGSLLHAQMLEGLLEYEGIESFVKVEILGSRNPGWPIAGGVKVVVSGLDVGKAS